MVIEIFAGSGRVTACLRQMGLSSAFGTDKVRNKNCVCPLVTVDLTENEDLLWKWLDDPFVVGVFLAPPCGSSLTCSTDSFREKRQADVVTAWAATFENRPSSKRYSLFEFIRTFSHFAFQQAVPPYCEGSQMGCSGWMHFCGRIPNIVCFGLPHSGLKLRIFVIIQFFTLVSMVVYGRKRQCLHSMPLNFWLSRQSALVRTAGISTPSGASAKEAMASLRLKRLLIQWDSRDFSPYFDSM